MSATAEAMSERSEFTIDELASVSQVPSRTIRFYQSRGALMPPEIRGRVAYYGAPHVARLKLIAQLQDRGLRIDAIRDLMGSIDRGELDLAEWLGVEQQVQAPWANDQARTVTEEELYELAASRRPGLLAELVRTGLVERHGDVYLLASPALLTVSMKLEAAGVDLETATGAAALVTKQMSRLTGDLVEFFLRRADDGRIALDAPGGLLGTLRTLGPEAVRVIFGREMERVLRKQLESGKLTSLPARARRARTKRRG